VSDEVGRDSADRWARVKRWWPIVVVGGLLLFPLLAVCVHLSDHKYGPIFDMALFEMRVRDVGTANTPLVGLGGRLATWPEIGAHPGPLAFYLFAPIYRLLGGTYWALRVANATFSAAAVLLTLFIARRRLGTLGVVATGVALALLELGLGFLVMTEPWNPYVPVMAFAPFLFAIWSVVAGDVKFLPVAAAVAAVCAQTHISFLAVCGGLGALAFALVLGRWIHAKRRGLPTRPFAVACLSAAAITLVLWIPPVIDQLTRERGNFTIVLEHLQNPPAPLVGWLGASVAMLQRLDVWFLLTHAFEKPGILRVPLALEPTPVNGAAVLLVWLLCTGLAWRLRDRTLWALHATVAAALLFGLVAASRIIGLAYMYVLFYGWIIGGLVFVSILATLALFLQKLGLRGAIATSLATAPALVGITVVIVRLMSTIEEAGARDSINSRQLAHLARASAQALRERGLANGHYVVTWDDAVYGGGQGVGLIVEMERYGIDVSVAEGWGFIVGQHRVVKPGLSSGRIHFANWGWIPEIRKQPGAVELAYTDTRPAKDRSEVDRLYKNITTALRTTGRPDLADKASRDLGAAKIPQIGVWNEMGVGVISNLGVPAAVFLLPP
jgi:hypothetical protein